jgi:hypothetical protein
MFTRGREIMINGWYPKGDVTLRLYRITQQIFDFTGFAAYNAAPSTSYLPDES